MNENIMKQILDEIEASDTIILSRHIRPDGDAVGSTKGLKGILSLTYPEKEVMVINQTTSEFLSFLGPEDAQVDEATYAKALVIVLDTATADRVDNPMIQKARRIIKIDHHVDIKPFGDVSWVEDQRSSVCELVIEFYRYFSDRLKIDVPSATCLYTGLVTDSGRFKFSTSPKTLTLGALMLEQGIDTEKLYANLYLDSFDFFKYQAKVFDKMHITPNGVAYLHVTTQIQKEFNLTQEQASNSVSFMDNIKDSLIWIAFIDNTDGVTTRVRIRSRFVEINKLAERYSGGGHEFASGATVHDEKEMESLVSDADALLGEFKSTHEGWL